MPGSGKICCNKAEGCIVSPASVAAGAVPDGYDLHYSAAPLSTLHCALAEFAAAAVAAVPFSPLGGGRFAPERVDPVGDGLQVGRVNAGAVPAKVVYYQPLGDGAGEQLVGEPVGEDSSLPAGVEPAVAFGAGFVAGPVPAGAEFGAVLRNGAALVNFAPEAFFRGETSGVLSGRGFHRVNVSVTPESS